MSAVEGRGVGILRRQRHGASVSMGSDLERRDGSRSDHLGLGHEVRCHRVLSMGVIGIRHRLLGWQYLGVVWITGPGTMRSVLRYRSNSGSRDARVFMAGERAIDERHSVPLIRSPM